MQQMGMSLEMAGESLNVPMDAMQSKCLREAAKYAVKAAKALIGGSDD